MKIKEYESHISHAINQVIDYMPRLALTIVTLVVGLYLIRLLIKFLDKTFKARHVDPTLTPFLKSVIGIALRIMLFIMVAGMIGIETTSLLTMLGAASLAVGLALQGSLSNLAGGVLILILKPFKAGHIIESSGVTGTVEAIQLFYTVIKTPQGQRITIPNGSLSNSVIKNVSHYGERRIDLTYGISYNSNIKTAKETIEKIIAAEPKILKDHPINIYVEELTDVSVNIKVHIWVNVDDYSNVLFTITENIKHAFDGNGIVFSFPQKTIVAAKQ